MSDTPTRGNILAALPERGSTEDILKLLERGPVKIERVVSQGHTSPPGFFHEQASHEWRFVVQGEVKLEIDDPDGGVEVVELSTGDWVDLPAYRRYRIVETSTDPEAVWLAVHFYTFS